jgi:hypothetical protein
LNGYTYGKDTKDNPGRQTFLIFFNNFLMFFLMFTPCSPLFRNVLYILLEGNEKGVAAAWMG